MHKEHATGGGDGLEPVALPMVVEFQPGDVLRDGRYVVQQQLRSAREKSVYLGRDRKFDCQVAIDVFASNNSIMPDGLTVSAWEARVLGRLGDHPNIASVIDQWEDEEVAVMVSRYLSGGSLMDLIARSCESGEEVPAERILQVANEITRGLAYIHGRRILYLDLQPRNVLFDEMGAVHLVDFDTAVPFGQPDVSRLAGREPVVYLAPELTDSGIVDERADLYSLGATMYEMVAGRPPFAGSRQEIVTARRATPPPPVERGDLPGTLHDLVFRLLAADREQRPASATQVLDLLGGISTARADIERLLASDESARLEFKSVLRLPAESPKPGETRSREKLEPVFRYPALKSLAAFLNTDGGILVIGVTDDRKIIGIEADIPDRDAWRLAFDALVSRYLGSEALNYIDLRLEPWQGHTIAVIRCSPSKEPTWIGDDLYVRRTASTEKLATRPALTWCRQKWG